MENFTPVSAFAGGCLIGLGAAILLLTTGRIAGISGIVGGLLRPPSQDLIWRALFVAGLIVGALIYRVAAPGNFIVRFESGMGTVVAAGLLVGFGTRLGNGCTSGHGVCGIGRLSVRSLVATVLFMAAAIVTVYAVRHGTGGM